MHNPYTALQKISWSLINKYRYLKRKICLLNCPWVALLTKEPFKVISCSCRDSRSKGSWSRICDTLSSSRPGVMQKSSMHGLCSFNNIFSRSSSQEHSQINGNLLFQHNCTKHCRHFTSDASTVPQAQIMNIFSQTNKRRVIKYVQGMRQGPALTSGCKRQAAVLVPFCVVDGKPSVLFTVRSTNLVTNKGDVSFPGGMKDPDDTDVIQTAVRETEEELGLARVHTEIWAPLPPMPDRLGKIAVTPVLGFIQDLDISSLQLNPCEVDSVFTLSMDHLCSTHNQRYTRFKHGVVFPAFVNGPARVWGLTAIILDRTLAILFPDAHRVKFRFPNMRNKDKNDKK